MDFTTLAIAGLATIAIGALFQVFVYPYLSGDARAGKRLGQIASDTPSSRPGGKAADRSQDSDKRRKQVAESLKEIEKKGSSKRVSLEGRLKQAGLAWPKSKFFMFSGVAGVATAALAYYLSDNFLFLPIGLVVGGVGLPNWALGNMRKRRLAKFINAFPDAVDIIIRGVRAGLPLGDCLRVIAGESAEPVRSEFRLIIESTAMGLQLGEAVENLYERVPVQEANFFSIVINIQSKAGGNLSEALGNLSRVLRDRKKMKQKVTAMSQEAKASAGIIGALPFFVTGALYLTSPAYISLLFTNPTGRMIVFGCLVWMLFGILTMKKMINFDM